MIAEFLNPQDPRWTQFLTRTQHDFYHLPEYVEFSARYERGIPAAFYAEDGRAAFLAPMMIRELPEALAAPKDWYDAITPFGFMTPLLIPESDTTTLRSFLELLRQVGSELGITCAFFRLHPLIGLPHDALTEYGELVYRGQTVSIDLTLSMQEMWDHTCTNHQKNIRKLRRDGFTVVMDRWDLLGEFAVIYGKTMGRRGADPFYHFSEAYFEGLRAALSDRVHLCSVLSPEHEVAGACLLTSVSGIVTAHLAGTKEKFLHYAPMKLVFDYMRQWGKESGNHTLHLGGGVGCSVDSLFNFKAGFSPMRGEYFTYRMIFDQNRYTLLKERWEDQVPSVSDGSNFFPVYRRPLSGVPV